VRSLFDSAKENRPASADPTAVELRAAELRRLEQELSSTPAQSGSRSRSMSAGTERSLVRQQPRQKQKEESKTRTLTRTRTHRLETMAALYGRPANLKSGIRGASGCCCCRMRNAGARSADGGGAVKIQRVDRCVVTHTDSTIIDYRPSALSFSLSLSAPSLSVSRALSLSAPSLHAHAHAYTRTLIAIPETKLCGSEVSAQRSPDKTIN
jgi:hypothetical protein